MVLFSTHPTIKNKPTHWDPTFATNWQEHSGDLLQLRQHVEAGGAFIAAAMSSGHRSSSAFKKADLACVDIDEGLSIEDFLKHPLAASAAWAYTTASHRTEANRFRVVFQLPETITDASLYKGLITILSRSLGGDRSCTDACRLYYGNDAAEAPLWQPKASLSGEIMDDARREAAAMTMRPDASSLHYDDTTLEQAIYVLNEVLEPTADGNRAHFQKVTAACASMGNRIFPAWSDWASRGHHGKGKNSSQSSEKFFFGWKGDRTTPGSLFWLADNEQPGWRRSLPEELRPTGGGPDPHIKAAGYSHEDFLGDPDDLFSPSLIEEPIAYTQSIFDESKPWTTIAATAPEPIHDLIDEEEDPGAEFLENDFFDGPESEPVATDKQGSSETKKADKDKEDPEKYTSIKHHLLRLYKRLRLNTMSQQLEYGSLDKPQEIHDISSAYIYINTDCKKNFQKAPVHDMAHVIGYENRYNPVTRYLERVHTTCEPCPYFDRLATELLGLPATEDQNPKMPDGTRIADLILKRFLVGAVARILNPGCIHDWMPVLIGSQNCGKTTFLQYLTPPDPNEPGSYPWVSTVQQGISYIKDRPHVLHAGWIVVLDECERYFSRKYTEELKNLVSVAVDRSARKYENEKCYRRSFVLAGATNSADFLTDPTGNRRFMPIIVEGKVPSKQDPNLKIIDLDRLKQDRDSIWAAAYRAYLDNPVNTFTSWELCHVADYSSSFTKDNPIESRLQQAINGTHAAQSGTCKQTGKKYISLADTYEWLDIHVDRHKAMDTSIVDVLKRWGYTRKVVRVEDRFSRKTKQMRVWLSPK